MECFIGWDCWKDEFNGRGIVESGAAVDRLHEGQSFQCSLGFSFPSHFLQPRTHGREAFGVFEGDVSRLRHVFAQIVELLGGRAGFDLAMVVHVAVFEA